MRIHHMFIALIMLSLFTVVLASVAEDILSGSDRSTTAGLGIPLANYTDDSTTKNASNILSRLSIISTTEDTIGDIGDNSPGGIDASVSCDDDSDLEGCIQKSGLGVVSKVGVFLFSVPRTVFTAMATFFSVDPRFSTVAIMIFVLIVAIILVSSILRNRI